MHRAIIAPAAIIVLAAANLSWAAESVEIAGGTRLARIHHDQNLLPDRQDASFGSLLYDEKGELVLHDGNKTWMYTSGLFEAPAGGQRDWYGRWITYVHEFGIKTLQSGKRKIVLGLAGADRWAVIHDVIKVSADIFVAFYSANGGVKAAISDRPDGIFKAVQNFKIETTDAWEKAGGQIDSLESNGAHALIEDTDDVLTLWLGYDSYHVDETAGQLGWAKVRINKKSRTVEFVEKHPGNPLRMLPRNYIAARCGGNLAANVAGLKIRTSS